MQRKGRSEKCQGKGRGTFRTSSNIYEGGYFVKIANYYKPLTIFGRSCIIDVGLESKYTSD